MAGFAPWHENACTLSGNTEEVYDLLAFV